jgi:hypothetical protein
MTQERAMPVALTLPVDKLAFIIEKAREFDTQVDVDDPNSGSNPADDKELAVLEHTRDNPAEAELTAVLGGLNDDQLTELLALLWVGRGDFEQASWRDAVSQAREAKNRRIVRYLVGTPMLGDLVSEGLAELGVSVPLPSEEEEPR